MYHAIQLSENHYIVSDFLFQTNHEDGRFQLSRVYYITPKGHELIATIKSDKSWKKIKKILAPLGGVSLSVIEAIASGVSSAIIEKATAQP